jgi:hypothetical protein
MMSLLLFLLACGPRCEIVRYHLDLDGDGYGSPDTWEEACEAPYLMVANDEDCDDADRERHPGALDRCDGIDYDCDGEVDEDRVDVTLYLDADGDGYGSVVSWTGCGAPPSPFYRAQSSTDCDDFDDTVFPGARERCNGIDDDCDGTTDEDAVDAVDMWPDLDGDGYGQATFAAVVTACPGTPGTSRLASDCDDTRADIYDGAIETCDGRDNDCDGYVDELPVDGADYFIDLDNDGFGGAKTLRACSPGLAYVEEVDLFGAQSFGYDSGNYTYGYDSGGGGGGGGGALVQVFVAERSGDCNDSLPAVNPAALEVCNGRDDNCNGTIDDADGTLVTALTPRWYLDVDGDRFGRSNVSLFTCSQPPTYTASPGDCDDDDDEVFPGAEEVCNSIDDDCDDLVDADDPDLGTCP